MKRVAGFAWVAGWVAGVAGNPKSRVAGTPAYALYAQKVAGRPKSRVAGVAGVAHFCTLSLSCAHIRDQAAFSENLPHLPPVKHRNTCHPREIKEGTTC